MIDYARKLTPSDHVRMRLGTKWVAHPQTTFKYEKETTCLDRWRKQRADAPSINFGPGGQGRA